MTFLAPLLWSLMVLAIPVVMFYLIREQPRRRIVSTLLFWQDLQPKIHERPLWQKLRRWLSLLLQLLFLTLLVAALTRPLAPWDDGPAGGRVFVLDGSASMRAQDVAPNRFERAKDRLRERVRAMGARDEAAILLTGKTPLILSGWTSGKRRLLEAVDAAHPGESGADPRAAIHLAKELASTREDGSVVFLTDAVWDRELEHEFLADVDVEVVAGEPANAGITLFSAQRSLVAPGEYSVALRVDAAGTEPVRGEVELWRNETLVDAHEVTLTPDEPWEKTWTFRSDGPATLEARLAGFDNDRLVVDDRRSLTVEPLGEMDILLVSPPDAFLEAVFASIPQTNVVRVWPPEEVGSGDASRFFVFNQAVPPPDFQHNGLLLLAPEGEGFWGRRGGEIENPLVTEIDETAAAVRFASIDQVRMARAHEYEPAPDADVYVSSFDHPLVFGDWNGERPWAVVGFDLERSDFVLRAAFPVMMANLVQALREPDGGGISAEVPGPVQTRMARQDVGEGAASVAATRFHLGARPLWWWLVAVAGLWVFFEWWTYHRRITE